MALTIRHYGKIENGKKTYYNSELYRQQIAELEGQEFEEVIKKRHRKMTNDQSAYYRGGVLGTIAKHDAFIHFNKPDDIHEDIIAPMFLGYTKMVKIRDEQWEKKMVRSTADLNKDEMREFIEKVISWAAIEFGIIILDSTQYYLTLHKTEEI